MDLVNWTKWNFHPAISLFGVIVLPNGGQKKHVIDILCDSGSKTGGRSYTVYNVPHWLALHTSLTNVTTHVLSAYPLVLPAVCPSLDRCGSFGRPMAVAKRLPCPK